MRPDVVRLLKLLLAIFFVTSLMSVLSFAQSAQTAAQPQPAQAQAQQAPATTQPVPEQDRPFRKTTIMPSQPEQKASQVPDDLRIFKDPSPLPPEAVQEALHQVAQERLKQFLVEKREREGQRSGVDPGIYVRQVDGANVCGAIVSYNFSPGPNPQLESVTTCTPTNAVTTQRARVRHPKPAGPQVLKTVYQEPEKK